MSAYDLVVIGTGPGGYVCAIRAAQLGMKVAVIEKRATHGGTCLNIGCIPSKALLHASELFHEAGHDFGNMGIDIKAPKLNLPQMMTHKQEVIDANVQGVEFLLKKNKVDTFHGIGSFVDATHLQITADDGSEQVLETKNTVIATGSDSISLPGMDIDEKAIVTSTGALELGKVPKHLVVIGAGVIGLELGSVWGRLGAKVTVIEFLDRVLPGMDSEVCKNFQRMLDKQGFDFKLSTKVTGVTKSDTGLTVSTESATGGDATSLEADIVLVAIGRKAYTEGLDADKAGVSLDDRGRVQTDGHCRTSVSNIFAIGDVTDGAMLAHKAEEEGVMVAEILAGQAGHINHDLIPGVVYTSPEVAAIGKTEDDLKTEGIPYNKGKFGFMANGRARAMRKSDGFVKVLAHKETDRILGVHILGHNAGEMIHEAAVLMEFSGSAEDLARICHAHPTMSEAVKEAALDATGKRAIHM